MISPHYFFETPRTPHTSPLNPTASRQMKNSTRVEVDELSERQQKDAEAFFFWGPKMLQQFQGQIYTYIYTYTNVNCFMIFGFTQ